MNTFVKSDITEQVKTVVCTFYAATQAMTVVCTFYVATHGCNSGTYIMYMCTFIFKLSKKKYMAKKVIFNS